MRINLGGIVHLSTIDWIGEAATVVFLRGCPLRCPHCQNRSLQAGLSFADLCLSEGVLKVRNEKPMTRQATLGSFSYRRRGREGQISAIVLSGGEPLMQPAAVRALAMLVKREGLLVGLETCGFYPRHLRSLARDGLLDRVFLDLKAPLRDPDYLRATGVEDVAPRVQESLAICLSEGLPLEVRTTVFPEMPGQGQLEEMARFIDEMKVEYPENRLLRFAIQQGRPLEAEFQPIEPEVLEEMARVLGAEFRLNRKH